jgi:uncharacterized protein
VLLELLIGLAGIATYAILPSRLKRIFWFNLIILVPTGGFIIWRQLASGYTWPQLGIRTDGWLTGVMPVALFVANAACVMAAIAVAHNRFRWTRNMSISAALYPLWGCAQQFLILSFINVRLQALHWSEFPVAVVTALAFMALHVPDRWLMPATFILGFVFSLLFQLEPNLIALGFAHGWLGLLYYYWVMNKDPLAEKFGKKSGG